MNIEAALKTLGRHRRRTGEMLMSGKKVDELMREGWIAELERTIAQPRREATGSKRGR